MNPLLRLLGVSALALFAACGARSSPQPGAPPGTQRVSAPRGAQPRPVAFDNTYGRVTALTVYVRVDGGSEQTLSAPCNQAGCIVWVPLTNAPHTLTLAVEQDGKRSEATTFTFDPPAGAK